MRYLTVARLTGACYLAHTLIHTYIIHPTDANNSQKKYKTTLTDPYLRSFIGVVCAINMKWTDKNIHLSKLLTT